MIARFGYKLPLHVLVEARETDDGAAPRARSVLRSPANRSALVQQIAFYKSRGFGYQDQPASKDQPLATWLVRTRSRVYLRKIDLAKGRLVLQGNELEALGKQLETRDGTSGNLEISFNNEAELGDWLKKLADKGVIFSLDTKASAGKFPALRPEFESQ